MTSLDYEGRARASRHQQARKDSRRFPACGLNARSRETYIIQDDARARAGNNVLGMTAVIVEQNTIAALKPAERAVTLGMGRTVFDGAAAEMPDDDDLREDCLAI